MVRHYYISVKNNHNADCSIYYGTNLPKMAKAYFYLQTRLGNTVKFKLDIDENYDPDCGAFKSFTQIFDYIDGLMKFGQKPLIECDKVLDEIRKEFGEEAN